MSRSFSSTWKLIQHDPATKYYCTTILLAWLLDKNSQLNPGWNLVQSTKEHMQGKDLGVAEEWLFGHSVKSGERKKRKKY